MKCPHCLVEVHQDWKHQAVTNLQILGRTHRWNFFTMVCPACSHDLVFVNCLMQPFDGSKVFFSKIVYPKDCSRPPVSPLVPAEYANDYNEAALILNDSPKASAALSRRIVQHLLVKEGKSTERDLAKQIDECLSGFPAHTRQFVDAIRNLGNIAAHPMVSKSTGQIADVEPHEAELLLDTIDQLFDFYFVHPAEAKKKLDALNSKLKDLGKPELKK